MSVDAHEMLFPDDPFAPTLTERRYNALHVHPRTSRNFAHPGYGLSHD